MVNGIKRTISMTINRPDIPFSSYIYATAIGHLVFALPTMVGALLLNLIRSRDLFFIIIPMAIISVSTGAAIAWLFAKGSNWTKPYASIAASCSVPGRIYPMLFGGLLGFHYFDTIGGIIFAVLFYLAGLALSFRLGKFLTNRLISEASTE